MNKNILFKYPYYSFHTKTTRAIDKWLKDNCIEIENHNYLDGIGDFDEYIVFKLKSGEHCIISSDWKGEYLKQTITKLNNSEIKQIKVHRWLKDSFQ